MEEGRDEKGRFTEGNKEAEYTHDEMRKLIKEYIAHIKEGFTKEAFVPCSYKTIESHIHNYPSVFQSEKKLVEQAFRANRLWWEERGKKGLMVGKRFNATTWIFNMKNRFEEWKDVQHRKNEDKVDANITTSQNITVSFGTYEDTKEDERSQD